MAMSADRISERVLARAQQLSGNTIPVDVEGIARACGVVEISARPLPLDGYLARRPDGAFAIRYLSGSHPRRVRFTIAHEIGHLIIADETKCPLDGVVARGSNRSTSVERLANRFASEILMPACQLNRIFQDERLSWSLVHHAAEACKVSREAILRRLMELPNRIAFEIRISLDQPTVRPVRWFFSNRRVLLTERPQILYDRLLSEMESRVTHSVNVAIGSKTTSVGLLGRVAKEQGGTFYRVVGIVPQSRVDS